jgi:organic hydroperoxide reductase OsmC/OhrA
MVGRVKPLHEQAHRMCFLARSVSFPVRHEPRTTVG